LELDEFGFCVACRQSYEQRGQKLAELTELLRSERPGLFEGLSAGSAARFAAHLVGQARIGGGLPAALTTCTRNCGRSQRDAALGPSSRGGVVASTRVGDPGGDPRSREAVTEPIDYPRTAPITPSRSSDDVSTVSHSTLTTRRPRRGETAERV